MTLAAVLLLSGFLYQDAEADRLVRSSMEATYDFRLAEARADAEKLQRLHPDHPVGFLLNAETYWWEAQAKPGDRNIEDSYYRLQKEAVARGEEALKANHYPATELLANLGTAYGSYARFQLTQKSAHFSALRAGLKAHGYAKRVYQNDASYYDIYVGLGAYNYFTGALPAVIKPFAYLIGARGDKVEGLNQLRLASQKGRYARTEALIVYYTTLLQERNFGEAFQVLQQLMGRFEHNPVLLAWAAQWFETQERRQEGIDYMQKLALQRLAASPAIARHSLLEKAGLEWAAGRRDAARATLEKVRSMPGQDGYVSAHLAEMEKKFR